MKCPHCNEEIELTFQPDSGSYLQGMGKLTAETKISRIWNTAENLASNAFLDSSAKSRTKEKLLELFKYYLKELMKSEGE